MQSLPNSPTALPTPQMALSSAYEEVKALIARNRVCLDLLVELLLSKERVMGDEVRELVEGAAEPSDLGKRAAEAGMAVL